MGGRGALLVLEGCDKVGKSTQAKLLVEALNNFNIPAVGKSFPDRTSEIGKLLNKFLKKEVELPLEAAHLLFSANRWEFKQYIIKTLMEGTTLVVDRYAYSGAAYTAAATDKSLAWCQEADRGLPSPDLVAFFRINDRVKKLDTWDGERYDNVLFQEKVSFNFDRLNDGTWKIIDSKQDIYTIHKELLNISVDTVRNVTNRTIGQL
ncbi:PREDICTED: thymidylate kinase [Polistes dominula]|uniref:dTMP kinase n=1 Tax=Polistes dominula TaxID=743375 RepID=A0ABM1IAR2_POLDO|nr:PREDICTED: thymidylate kinase [Polistes dominula]